MNKNSTLLYPFWKNLIGAEWIFGLVLIFLWGVPRFILVLYANESGSYQWVSLIFVSMWFTPWIFLSKYGRKKMGLKKPDNFQWLLFSLFLGLAGASFIFLVNSILYQEEIANSFVYISKSYSNIPENLNHSDRLIYFSIYAVISMIFSPIGEEFFYRGIIHECMASKWGDSIASIVDSSAFSITHLAHFGIIYHLGQWQFLFFPSIIWMLLLFLSCLFFFLARKRSGSILGAILAHAGFNFAMMYFIFYHIL